MNRSQSGSAWRVKFSPAAERDLGKLDRAVQQEILKFLNRKIASVDNPRRIGQSLYGSLAGLWRYRVRDYRIICRILDREITVLVVAVGHRKEVYR